MANPANYQRSGTEPIRSNQIIKRSTDLNPGLTASGKPSGGLRVSDATIKHSTTLNPGLTASGKKSGGLSTYDVTVKAAGLGKSGASGAKDSWPSAVQSFDDAET